jgi:two-component system, NtrC family, sensor kinase
MTIAGAQVRKSAATVRMNLEADLPLIQGHSFKLEQVVVNLLINASQAIPDKSRGRIRARTRYVERLRSVLIEVEDNGAGMSQEVMNRIFDPFFTTRRGTGGTGLGLSVSYGLVQEHHGIIGVLSRVGLGSRFTVILPVDQDMRLDLSPLILCIDDDVPFLNMLDAHFVRIKKAVKTLSHPEEVLTLLEEHPEVDIVLCDIKMPGLNGWEVLNLVKSRFPLLTVILYSGDVTALKPDSHQPHEPDYLLAKPFRMKDLATIINRIERQLLCGF